MDKTGMSKRIAALLMALVLLGVLFLSASFIITHAKHHCTGKDCPVCAQLNVCISALGEVLEAVGILVLCLVAYLCVEKAISWNCARLFFRPTSLVRLKVRLNN